MKRDWLKLLGSIALATAMAGGTVAYAEENGWSNWDTDGSGDLSSEEWDAGFNDEGVYSEWDENGDGALTEQEFGEGVFNSYDKDGDGTWNEEEYNTFSDDAGDEGFWDV